MADGQRAEGMDISAFFGVLRRRLLIIAVAVVVASGAAYFASKGQDPVYEATSQLLLKGATSGGTESTFAAQLPTTASDREAQVTRGEVLESTQRTLAKRIGKARAAEAMGGISAFSGEDSDAVQITSEASSPDVTALAANTLAQANIDFRKAQTLRRIKRAQDAVEADLARQGTPTAGNAAAISSLQTDLSDLRGAAATAEGDAEIVDRATAPSSPSSPKPKRNALIGAFGGLLLGLALALVREQLDRRVRNSKGLEDAFGGLPVLASVPKSRSLGGQNGKALEQLPARDAEAFQLLRANLRYLNTDRELRSVVVTSTGVGDGKSTVALNLAKAEAIVGRRVLLIEADIRRPKLGGLLGLHDTEGLASFLSDKSKPLMEVTTRVPVASAGNGTGSSPNTLDVVVAGTIPPNPSELIDSDRMRELIREAEENYDLVVIDTAPATMVADAIPLMSEATAVVIVGRVGRITSTDANALREQLERIDAPAFGLVANFTAVAGKSGYGYY